MQTTIRALIGAALVVTAFGVAVAKLPPAPPMTDQQKAEKAAKDKATSDAAKAELTRAEDKAVANYVANEKAKGVTPKTLATEGASGESKGAANAHSPAKK
jgi:uncharacterized low-complexity protein